MLRTRGLFLGLLEFAWALAGGVGPVLGGTFTQLLSWRWCWWINIPFASITFITLLIWLDVHNPRTNVMEGIKAVDVSVLLHFCSRKVRDANLGTAVARYNHNPRPNANGSPGPRLRRGDFPVELSSRHLSDCLWPLHGRLLHL